MITGVVRLNEARVRLSVNGRLSKHQIEAVIDTGFTASLSLPPDVIRKLGLKWRRVERSILADGSECLVDVFEGSVEWDGKTRRISIDEADTDPLIGMALLKGYELKMQIRSRGKVTIKRLR